MHRSLLIIVLLSIVLNSTVYKELKDGNRTKKYAVIFAKSNIECFIERRGEFYDEDTGECYIRIPDYIDISI